MAGANTVTVACKVPNGIILRNYKLVDGQEPVMGGGSRTVKIPHQVGDDVKLNGFAHPIDKAPTAQISGGYGLTFNVNKEFWDTWLKANKDSDLVKNGLVFAHEKPEHVAKQSSEQKKVRSGLEPLDTESKTKATSGKLIPSDPRMPRGIEKEGTKIEA